MRRPLVLLAAAAAIMLVGGALAVGSGVLRRTPVVPPVIAPSIGPLAVASSDAKTPSPSDLPRPSESPIAAAGPGGDWIRTRSMSTPRYSNVALRLADGRVLVAGGQANNHDNLTSAELYDPATGSWSATGSLIHPLDSTQATLLRDGRVLVDDELYDPTAGSWAVTGKPSDGGGPATLLADGRVLLTGSSSQLYDPDSGTWSLTGKMITTRFSIPIPVRLLDGRVLVAGGSNLSDHKITSAELYDPTTGTWSATGRMIHAASGARVLLSDGRVLADDELYDPTTGTWATSGNTSIGGGSATLLADGSVLFPGRPSETDFNPSHIYDPATGSWTEAASLLPDSGIDVQSAVLLLDGTVLVAGGPLCSSECPNGPDGATGSAQLYIPAGVSAPTGLAPVPAPTPTPTPAPTPTPYPPMAGPVPQGARRWEVTVENKSSKPATLFLATEPLTDMSQLCGSITPDVVSAHTTEKVTFQLPPKSVNDCWLMVRPGPGASGDHGPTNEWPIPGKLVIQDGGDNANGDDLSVLWQGP